MTFEEFDQACTCPSGCTCPACSGITFDETTKLWRKEHRPQPQEDVVWKALLALRDACDLRSELGTDILFHVLFEGGRRALRSDDCAGGYDHRSDGRLGASTEVVSSREGLVIGVGQGDS
jgi:hypothetical protein